MSSKTSMRPFAIALGAAFAGGLAATGGARADANPFGLTPLSSGYMLAAHDRKSEGSESNEFGPNVEGKCGEGKCATGACGGHHEGKVGPNVEGKCGEGKCATGACGGHHKKDGGGESGTPENV